MREIPEHLRDTIKASLGIIIDPRAFNASEIDGGFAIMALTDNASQSLTDAHKSTLPRTIIK